MTHVSQQQLKERLDAASQLVTVGARYLHYRQQTYRVLSLALREEDLVPVVIYQAEYGERVTFTRPVDDWLETVVYNGKRTPRFTEIAD